AAEHRVLARSAGLESRVDRRGHEGMVRVPDAGGTRGRRRSAMKPDFAAGASAYLAGFARLLERVEVTGRGGAPLAVDSGLLPAVDRLVSVRSAGGKALLVGNGGSAAIVSHIHNDLCKAVGMRAVVFNEPPLLTALANDDGYENVFAYPVALWADKGDVLIAVTSSGESANIVAA